jgi:hypothetical protein
MRKVLPVFVALAAAWLACAARPAAAQQEGFEKSQVRIDIPPEVLENDCTGESLLVTGFLHQTFFRRVDSGGGNSLYRSSGVHETAHTNGQGLTAVGMTSGTTYRVSVISNTSAHDDFYSPASGEQDFANTFSSVLQLSFNAPGAGNNYRATMHLHFTVNANGEATAEVAPASALQCR